MKTNLEPAMYMKFEGNGNDKKIVGLAVTHVDDILHMGEDSFDNGVMQYVKKAFSFGSEEVAEFRYVGMNFRQVEGGVIVDQSHYVKDLELPDMEVCAGLDWDTEMSREGQREFRSVVGKLLSISVQSRPDVCFEAKCLSTLYNKATKHDLKIAMKKLQKLQGIKTEMFFPDLGRVEDWCIVAHGDAGIKSMPDKLSSCGGTVVMVVNTKTNRACIINWRSKKIQRKVPSSIAGEALAMLGAIGSCIYYKAVLKSIYGSVMEKIPIVVYTDAKNLTRAVHTTSMVEDEWLIVDIAAIKDALEDGTVSSIRRVAGTDMLADCLTKQGASADKLMEVLHTGFYEMPEGLLDGKN